MLPNPHATAISGSSPPVPFPYPSWETDDQRPSVSTSPDALLIPMVDHSHQNTKGKTEIENQPIGVTNERGRSLPQALAQAPQSLALSHGGSSSPDPNTQRHKGMITSGNRPTGVFPSRPTVKQPRGPSSLHTGDGMSDPFRREVSQRKRRCTASAKPFDTTQANRMTRATASFESSSTSTGVIPPSWSSNRTDWRLIEDTLNSSYNLNGRNDTSANPTTVMALPRPKSPLRHVLGRLESVNFMPESEAERIEGANVVVESTDRDEKGRWRLKLPAKMERARRSPPLDSKDRSARVSLSASSNHSLLLTAAQLTYLASQMMEPNKASERLGHVHLVELYRSSWELGAGSDRAHRVQRQIDPASSTWRSLVKWMSDVCAKLKWTVSTCYASIAALNAYIVLAQHQIPLKNMPKIAATCLYYASQMQETAVDDAVLPVDRFLSICPEVGTAQEFMDHQVHLVDTLQGINSARKSPFDFLLLFLSRLQSNSGEHGVALYRLILQRGCLPIMFEALHHANLTYFYALSLHEWIPAPVWIFCGLTHAIRHCLLNDPMTILVWLELSGMSSSHMAILTEDERYKLATNLLRVALLDATHLACTSIESLQFDIHNRISPSRCACGPSLSDYTSIPKPSLSSPSHHHKEDHLGTWIAEAMDDSPTIVNSRLKNGKASRSPISGMSSTGPTAPSTSAPSEAPMAAFHSPPRSRIDWEMTHQFLSLAGEARTACSNASTQIPSRCQVHPNMERYLMTLSDLTYPLFSNAFNVATQSLYPHYPSNYPIHELWSLKSGVLSLSNHHNTPSSSVTPMPESRLAFLRHDRDRTSMPIEEDFSPSIDGNENKAPAKGGGYMRSQGFEDRARSNASSNLHATIIKTLPSSAILTLKLFRRIKGEGPVIPRTSSTQCHELSQDIPMDCIRPQSLWIHHHPDHFSQLEHMGKPEVQVVIGQCRELEVLNRYPDCRAQLPAWYGIVAPTKSAIQATSIPSSSEGPFASGVVEPTALQCRRRRDSVAASLETDLDRIQTTLRLEEAQHQPYLEPIPSSIPNTGGVPLRRASIQAPTRTRATQGAQGEM